MQKHIVIGNVLYSQDFGFFPLQRCHTCVF